MLTAFSQSRKPFFDSLLTPILSCRVSFASDDNSRNVLRVANQVSATDEMPSRESVRQFTRKPYNAP